MIDDCVDPGAAVDYEFHLLEKARELGAMPFDGQSRWHLGVHLEAVLSKSKGNHC